MNLGTSHFVRFSPDGVWLATSGVGSVRLRRVGEAKPAWTFKVKHPASADVSPDSSTLLVKTTAGDLYLYGPLSGTPELRQIAADLGEGPGPRFCHDGESIFTASKGGQVLVIRLPPSLEVIGGRQLDHLCFHAVRFPSGDEWLLEQKPAAVSSTSKLEPPTFLHWAPFEGGDLQLPHAPGLPRVADIAIEPAGRVVAILHDRRPSRLALYDLKSREVVKSTVIDEGPGAKCVTWNPSGGLVVGRSNRVHLLDPDLAPQGEVQIKYGCACAFSPDGEWIALGSWERGQLLRTSEL